MNGNGHNKGTTMKNEFNAEMAALQIVAKAPGDFVLTDPNDMEDLLIAHRTLAPSRAPQVPVGTDLVELYRELIGAK